MERFIFLAKNQKIMSILRNENCSRFKLIKMKKCLRKNIFFENSQVPAYYAFVDVFSSSRHHSLYRHTFSPSPVYAMCLNYTYDILYSFVCICSLFLYSLCSQRNRISQSESYDNAIRVQQFTEKSFVTRLNRNS